LLIETGGKLSAIEIKASHSYSSEFLKSINKFRDLTKNDFLQGSIISNNEEQFSVQDINIVN
jgi:hypothetical protein